MNVTQSDKSLALPTFLEWTLVIIVFALLSLCQSILFAIIILKLWRTRHRHINRQPMQQQQQQRRRDSGEHIDDEHEMMSTVKDYSLTDDLLMPTPKDDQL